MRHLPIVVATALIAAPLLVSLPADAETGLTPQQLKERLLQRQTKALALPEGGAGNGIFQVYVEQSPVLAPGAFTVLTGPDNPAGEGQNVLFGNGVPGTSYLIIRRTTADGTVTDYVQGQLLTHATEVSLDSDYEYTEEIGTTGYISHWGTDFGNVQEQVEVVGTTRADSTIEVTTTIDPLLAQPDDEFQVQYIWDVAIGADDGPVLQELPAGGAFEPFDPVVTTEQQVATTRLAVADNDGNAAPPNLAIAVGATGSTDSVKYVCWTDAIYGEFGAYEIDPSYDVSTTDSTCTNSDGDNDSAVVTVWPTALASGGVMSVTSTLSMTPPAPHSTSMTAEPVLLRSPPFTATLLDASNNAPLGGRTIEFLVGNTVRCTDVSDADGVASCGTFGDGLAATLALGYTARYAGGAIWSSVSAHGGLL